ncbi:MAG: hypothetical protein MZV64_34630 [Ignavibacteriales bacterium]|nr:hypothetical protein [Ignavibacteriales bacterium]
MTPVVPARVVAPGSPKAREPGRCCPRHRPDHQPSRKYCPVRPGRRSCARPEVSDERSSNGCGSGRRCSGSRRCRWWPSS